MADVLLGSISGVSATSLPVYVPPPEPVTVSNLRLRGISTHVLSTPAGHHGLASFSLGTAVSATVNTQASFDLYPRPGGSTIAGAAAYASIPAEASRPLSAHRSRELEWRRTHVDILRAFSGQWVALEGEEIIAHGTDPLRVVARAREKGISVPYIFRVETQHDNVVRIGL